ncbi:MAG: Hsp20 family protein [Bdellovibrionales bacterium]|nr:Hsp20 family protein [Bdellovibrionales bacterium]
MDIRSKSTANDYASSSEARSRQESERRVKQAEQDAQERIDYVSDQARETENELQRRTERLRAEGHARLDAERERIEQQVEAEKKKQYQQLAELRRRNDAELARTKKEAEKTEGQLKEHYERDLNEVTRVSSKAVRDAYMQNLRQFEQQQADAKNQREMHQAMEQDRLQNQKNHYEELNSKQLSQARADQQKLRNDISDSRTEAEQHYQERFSQAIGEHQRSLQRLNAEAGRQLKDLRETNSEKLSKFDSRAEDPFYRMVHLDTRLRETDDAFILTAKAPSHEHDNIKVQVQGNQIVLSGSRRNEDQVKLGEGRARSTASFQNFRETFPVDWPVDPNRMLREADGDRLIFTFPKKAGLTDPENGSKKSLEYQTPARAPRPDFPENLVAQAPQRNFKPII